MVPRFYCPDALPRSGPFNLPEAAAHHARKVLRMRIGDPMTLFDGRGEEAAARLIALEPKVCAQVLGWSCPPTESPLELVLVQALASGDKMDWVVQKAVELGVAGIVPLVAARCVLKLSAERADKRVRHWRQIIIAACEQSGRNRLPVIERPIELGAYLARPADARRLVLAPRDGRRLAALEGGLNAAHLLVGPEGGWTESELAQMQSAGCEPIELGPRVLRTETAGLAAAAAMHALWGDW